MWGQPKRIKGLRAKYLPSLGAYWRGTDEEFLEFLIMMIEQMPAKTKDAMRRHYIDADTRRRNPETGKPLTEDSRYYLLLSEGRSILATRIKEAQSDKRITQKLEKIYG